MIYRSGGKRLLDLMLSLSALALLALPILLSIVAVKLSSPGPAFFRQRRVGRNGQVFLIYKLRTMIVDPNRLSTVQVDDRNPGVFATGRFLRRFKIDEMPQIFNVVLGEMSLVGPRPCLEATCEGMPSWAHRRFQVRPGITGLAQTRGNVALSWDLRWKKDVEYVDKVSLLLDIRLLLKTALVVIMGEEKFEQAA
jgi:undecaprenyl phosphate N,N'-diacetylbacillosamine 1-phosphate transferase